MIAFSFGLLLATGLLFLLPSKARGEEVYFPPDAGVIDVTQSPYFARGDGRTDDTEAIQQALLDHPNENRIIYLPNGTYRISATLRWPSHEQLDARWRATILQGQSRDGVTLRLMDFSPGFNNSGRPRAMLWTGDKGYPRERNAIRNLTLNTGLANQGAIGIQFTANRQGCIRDVRIVSGGARLEGVAGLDLTHADQNGPFYVANLTVRGFDYGIRTTYPVYGATFEHIVLTDQRECGFRNSSQSVSIRDLRSTNRVAALDNTDSTGVVALLDAVLQGTATNRVPPAIRNKGIMFARNLTTHGHSSAVDNRAGHDSDNAGPEVREFVSHAQFNLFPAPQYSLNLPVRETPEVPLDPPDQWVSPAAFGGVPDDHKDDAEAIQKAIDSGKSTLYFPNGTWRIQTPIEIRANIRRIIGCEARLDIREMRAAPAFTLTNGVPPLVLIERLEIETGNDWFLNRVAPRQLVIKDCLDVRATFEAGGDLFVEDVSSTAPWKFKDMNVFARQFTIETEATKITADGGMFWGLGLKADRPGTLVYSLNTNRTEVLGGLCVANGGWKDAPMFRLDDSSGSYVMAEASFSRAPFQTIVQERRGGVTRNLPNVGLGGDKLPIRVGGVALPMFAGYEGTSGNVAPRASSTGKTNAPVRR